MAKNEHRKYINLFLNLKNKEDKEIYDYLESIGSKTAYLRDLVLKDMNKDMVIHEDVTVADLIEQNILHNKEILESMNSNISTLANTLQTIVTQGTQPMAQTPITEVAITQEVEEEVVRRPRKKKVTF